MAFTESSRCAMRAFTAPRSSARTATVPRPSAANTKSRRKRAEIFMAVRRVGQRLNSGFWRGDFLVEIAEEVIEGLLHLHVNVNIDRDVNGFHLNRLRFQAEAAAEIQREREKQERESLHGRR